jgi:prolyl-tRNA editing enzyme YbaK/EbsC (Cys-tRNA(Pro) deacylase)
MTDIKPAAARVQDAAKALGLDIAIVTHAQSTRTAEEAAMACGCAVGQIVKSLVFQLKSSGTPVLLLVSGANRVDEKAVAGVIGEPLKRPDAATVRDLTGYAIGGIPPLGHARPLKTYIDKDLLAFDQVWAAAGTPDSVFAIDPKLLAEKSGAVMLRVAQSP